MTSVKTNMSVRKLFSLLLFLIIFALSLRDSVDPDLWWHMRTGAYILENGIPRQDPNFSYTVTDHEWITHEWLTDVIMVALYDVGGLPLLGLFFAGVVTAAFWSVYRVMVGRPYLAGLLLLWGFAACLPFVGARPQMMNILMAGVFIALLEGVKDGRLARKWLWSIPFLTLIWANLHSGFLLGLVILGVYVVGEGVQLLIAERDVRGLGWVEIQQLILIGVASTAAAMVNPNTWELIIYPFLTLGSGAMRDFIFEWHSPDFHVWYYWLFGSLLLGGGLLLIVSPRRLTVTEGLLFFGTGAAGLQSVRHIPLFAIMVLPILARHAAAILAEKPLALSLIKEPAEATAVPRPMQLANWLLLGLAVLALPLYAVTVFSSQPERIETTYPVAAVEFLKAEGLQEARLFNDYDWGGYLIWREVPVFIDGRADVYGDEFFRAYMQTFQATSDWRETLEAYDIELILTRTDGNFGVLLTESEEWALLYQDEVATIYQLEGSAAPILAE